MIIKGTRKEVEKILETFKKSDDNFNLDNYEIVITDSEKTQTETAEERRGYYLPNNTDFYYEVYPEYYSRKFQATTRRGGLENMHAGTRVFPTMEEAILCRDLLNNILKHCMSLEEFHETVKNGGEIFSITYNRINNQVQAFKSNALMDALQFYFNKDGITWLYTEYSEDDLIRYYFNIQRKRNE